MIDAGVELAGLAERLACPAGPVAAVQRDVDPGPVGGVGDGLVIRAGDESGDAVLEGERHLILRHAGSSLSSQK